MSARRESGKSRNYALVCWELSRSDEGVTFERFARIVGAKATHEAGKRAFYHFAAWARSEGVSVRMVENVAEFDRKALGALGRRFKTNVSPVTVTKSAEECPAVTKSDQRLTVKEAASMIGVHERVLGRWLRREVPPFPVLRAGRAVRVREIDVRAWINANTIGAKR